MRLLFALIPLACAASVGVVDFKTSAAAPETQACFNRAVGMLHNFWFEEAREQFQACTKSEPDFAMGYWGEAMTWNHSLWNRVWPDEARAVLKKVPAGAQMTARERAYLDAVRTLFGEGQKREREMAYSSAMEKIHREHPEDQEAAAFYALSLIALGSERQRMQAGAIVLDVYDANRDHPGAAHYIIHAFDDPVHAILALPAARRYAEIAPESHHALHMPSHIFLQLGMWPDTVEANERAWAASVAWQQRKNHPLALRDYHSQYWLAYGYLQQGRFDDAWKIYDDKKKDLIAAQGAGEVFRYWSDLAAALIFETEAWDRAATAFDNPVVIRRAASEAHAHLPAGSARAVASFTQGFAAARTGGDIQPHLDLLEQARQVAIQREQPAQAARIEAMQRMIEAKASAHKKDYPTAFAKMKEATALEEKDSAPSGPPDIIKPSHELYGELLLEAGRSREAIALFERSLERQPNRTRSVRGLEKARRESPANSGE
jgi:tetratricopeptide (TPR) repeat protein